MLQVDEFRSRLTRFNKHVLNPLMLSFAGRPRVPYGIIQHIGRRSGSRYTTPVLVGMTGYAFCIPLPYGNATDWSLNLQEEGGGLIVYGGEAYRVIEPRIVPPQAAAGAFPGWMKAVLAAAGATHYMQLQRAAPSPEPVTVYQRITADYPAGTGLLMMAGLLLIILSAIWIVRTLLNLRSA
jgi:deazaflavin-dependent oxidoreductase (nitroreductase family)